MGKPLPGRTIEEKLRFNIRLDGECHRWTGAHTPKGYGQLKAGGRVQSVHRLAYELWIGLIPEGFEPDHLCRVRDCINPAHLEAVTHQENLRRRAALITHCPHGHEYTPENIKWLNKQDRVAKCRSCRTCYNLRRAVTRLRAKENS